ncbi:MAG: hypothetical protein ACOC2W_03805 [bacterium]
MLILKPRSATCGTKVITKSDFDDWKLVLIDNQILFIESNMIGEKLQLIDLFLTSPVKLFNVGDYVFNNKFIGTQGFNKIIDIDEEQSSVLVASINDEFTDNWVIDDIEKIFASSNIEHDQPQLSFDAISDMMAYHGDNGSLPELVMVENQITLNGPSFNSIKLNDGMVDITLKESSYTDEDLDNYVEKYCAEKDNNSGETWSNDYFELPDVITQIIKSDFVKNYWFDKFKKVTN